MPAYKDPKGKWYISVYYDNWQGIRTRKLKRGFATRKEALEWERIFLMKGKGDLDMSFGAFVELYKTDLKDRLKLNTWIMKESVIDQKILPFFKEKKMNDIRPSDIIAWQNTMMSFKDENGNPYLKVFSAHLHMDEATPHLHIDFVPFTTGSKRGLDIRVSLKQALANQGFKGGTRGDTEWNQWVSSEKEALAVVMERHGVEWERKGTHEKHLSVLDYKKQKREKELTELEGKLAERKDEFKAYKERIENFDNGERALQKLDESMLNEPEYQLVEPATMMSAKSYKAKFVDPFIKKLKSLIVTILARYYEARDNWHRITVLNNNLQRENEVLRYEKYQLKNENIELRKQNRQYSFLRKVFGEKGLEDLVRKAEEIKQAKMREKRKNYER